MKNKIKSKSIINTMGLCLIALAGIISNSVCWGLIGEPTPPEYFVGFEPPIRSMLSHIYAKE